MDDESFLELVLDIFESNDEDEITSFEEWWLSEMYYNNDKETGV